jgi:hypoxanthine phosphoribosyltransferase
VKLGRTLIDAQTLDKGVSRVAGEIDRDQKGRPALLVGILKGSIFFLCDLAKNLKTTPVTIDFLQVSSYGSGTKSSATSGSSGTCRPTWRAGDVIIVRRHRGHGRTLQKSSRSCRPGSRTREDLRALEEADSRQRGIPVDYLGSRSTTTSSWDMASTTPRSTRNLPFIGFSSRMGLEIQDSGIRDSGCLLYQI